MNLPLKFFLVDFSGDAPKLISAQFEFIPGMNALSPKKIVDENGNPFQLTAAQQEMVIGLATGKVPEE